MTDFNFKVGDKVYYPAATNEILTINSESGTPYVDINGRANNAFINQDGKLYKFHHNPSFFPATQEWYDRLVHTYPDLEKPPAQRNPKEITLMVLDGSHRLIKATEDVDGKVVLQE